MKVHFHFYVDSADPATGGLGVSANRLISNLLSMGQTRVTVYERTEAPLPRTTSSGAEIVPLFDRRIRLMEPFLGSNVLVEANEVYRAAFLVLRAAMRPRVASDPSHQHVVVSFYISAAGLVAQQVADELGLPHIASVRGTDFNKDFRSPYRFEGVRFVLKRAASIVTTSKAQEAALRPFVNERTSIRTIYNSAEPSRNGIRRRMNGEPIRISSDSGFSYKKGSHILLEAMDSALSAGYSVHLTVAGATDPAALQYWSSQKDRRTDLYPSNFRWLNHISQDEVAALLASTDIYCSASLGEGASNGITQAMVDGLPIVATDIGAFSELSGRAEHVMVVPAGDPDAYADALLIMLEAYSTGGLIVRKEVLHEWRSLLAPMRERHQWQEVVAEVLAMRGA